MELIKINIHSVVDLITNSSTTIYTYQNSISIYGIDNINKLFKNRFSHNKDFLNIGKSKYVSKKIENYIKIKQIKNVGIKTVYDIVLEKESSHLFTIDRGIITHNCGGGEPTEHPEFIELLKTFYDMGITPNYTTNGMNLDYQIFQATKKYCGGVALSCHNHLDKYWIEAIDDYSNMDIKLNLHIIISDKRSVDRFNEIFKTYNEYIDYFVLLPHTKKGRAEEKKLEHEYLFNVIDKLQTNKVAFGALFHPYLKNTNNRFGVSLYEPEIMSKYISFEGDGLMYKSSFCNTPIKTKLFVQ